MRKTVPETWAELEAQGWEMPRTASGEPFIPPGMPNHDDDELGFYFYKGGAPDADFSDMSLPRMLFGRSYLERMLFTNTALTESRMCWNSFEDCDFTGADLTGCDMRSSIFRRCKFVGAVMCGADLRRSTFEACEFLGADLAGVVIESNDDDFADCLSEQQQQVVAWTEDSGPEPPGG
jgi:BTB/POZ domain-containing protein KCTD9